MMTEQVEKIKRKVLEGGSELHLEDMNVLFDYIERLENTLTTTLPRITKDMDALGAEITRFMAIYKEAT